MAYSHRTTRRRRPSRLTALVAALSATLALAACTPDDTGASTPPDGPVPAQNSAPADDAIPTQGAEGERKVVGVVYPDEKHESKLPDGGKLTVISMSLEDFPASPKVIARFTITVKSKGEAPATEVTLVDFDVEMRRSVPGLKRKLWEPVFIQLDVHGDRGLHVHRETVLRQDTDFKVKWRELGVSGLMKVYVDFTVRPQGFDTLEYHNYVGVQVKP